MHSGQRADALTGLDYYNARYYDPVAGQFTSADTLLPKSLAQPDPQQLNRYAYVGGNPETRTDPTGHRLSYSQPFGTYMCCNISNFVSGVSAASALALQIKAASILAGVQKKVVPALDYQHNVQYYRIRNQGASAQELIDYATQSYRDGYLTTAVRGSGRVAQDAEAAAELMERGGGFLSAAKWIGWIGLAVGAAIDFHSSDDEWLQQHAGDTNGALEFAAARAGASTAGSLAGAWAGGVTGAFIGGAIGSILPGPGTMIGAYVGGFVGSAVGGYVGGAVGDWLVDSVANVNDPSNPVTAIAGSVSGWLSNA